MRAGLAQADCRHCHSCKVPATRMQRMALQLLLLPRTHAGAYVAHGPAA